MTTTKRSTRPRSAQRTSQQDIHLRDLSRSLPLALMRAREAVMQYFRPHHRQHGVTEQQWRVLRVLYRSGELETSELARQSLLLAPSLSRILRDLEATRMITRRTVASDLRRSVISITPAGVALLAKVAPLSEASFAEITARYGEVRLNQLFKKLTELEEALKRPNGAVSQQTDTPARKRRNGKSR